MIGWNGNEILIRFSSAQFSASPWGGGGELLDREFIDPTAPVFVRFSNNVQLPKNRRGAGGGGERPMIGKESGWKLLKNTERKSTWPSHLIISEQGTQAGYLKEYQPPLSPSPPTRKQEQNKGWHQGGEKRAGSREKQEAGREKLGLQRRDEQSLKCWKWSRSIRWGMCMHGWSGMKMKVILVEGGELWDLGVSKVIKRNAILREDAV